MASYIIRRLAWLIPIWLLVSFVTFLILYLAPGSPVTLMLGVDASQEAIVSMEKTLGLDKPFYIQYGRWLGQVLKGDFGTSILLKKPVASELLKRFPVTVSLTMGTLILAMLIGIPAGFIAAMKPNGFRDSTVMGISMIGISIPEFLLGLLLIYIIGVTFRWLPVGGYVLPGKSVSGWITHLLMPCFSLGFIHAALIARMTRASLLESLHADYVRTARAKGTREYHGVTRHAFRNAIIPVTTVIGVSAVILLGGAFITEALFNLPGVGKLVISAVQHRDYPIVQGGMLFIATVVIVLNLLVDLLYAYLDPRIHYE